MRRLLFFGALILSSVFVAGNSEPVAAESLRIQPLSYQTDLKKGEKKKGFVDIANPSNETVMVDLYVNGFSQINDKGELTFFENEQIRKGIQLDYETAEIGPRQTLRLYFIADGTKLPVGDVFGVLFAETQSAQRPGTNTTVRVGTLMMITNQTPGPRHAAIEKLDVAPFQLGDGVGGAVAVKNTAPKGAATGFFPDVTVELVSWGGKQSLKGPLIFADNTRTFDFYMSTNLFGFYQVKVKANDAEKTAVIFVMTGWWRILAPALLVLIVAGAVLLKKYAPFHRKAHLKRH